MAGDMARLKWWRPAVRMLSSLCGMGQGMHLPCTHAWQSPPPSSTQIGYLPIGISCRHRWPAVLHLQVWACAHPAAAPYCQPPSPGAPLPIHHNMVPPTRNS